MARTRDFLRDRVQRDQEDLPLLRANASSPGKDLEGSCSNILGITVRGVGVGQYVLNRNPARFHESLRESAQIAKRLIHIDCLIGRARYHYSLSEKRLDFEPLQVLSKIYNFADNKQRRRTNIFFFHFFGQIVKNGGESSLSRCRRPGKAPSRMAR